MEKFNHSDNTIDCADESIVFYDKESNWLIMEKLNLMNMNEFKRGWNWKNPPSVFFVLHNKESVAYKLSENEKNSDYWKYSPLSSDSSKPEIFVI